MKISCIVGGYNEAQRLPAFFEHATKWADEVIYFDKCSTDDSLEIVQRAAAGRGDTAAVRSVSVPFSRAGFENPAEYVHQARNDWIFFMTPGEVPTRGLIDQVRTVWSVYGHSLDLVCIPKKLYSFGIHDEASPWSISYQPFLVNRRRAVIGPNIHGNFSLRPGGQAMTIPFSETCHVLHPTHATFEGFLASHYDYILAESAALHSEERTELVHSATAKLQECVEMLQSFDFGRKPEMLSQAFAWAFYWNGVALAAVEKIREAADVPKQYRELTIKALEEWRK